MTCGSVFPFEGITDCGSPRAVASPRGSSHVVRLSLEGDR